MMKSGTLTRAVGARYRTIKTFPVLIAAGGICFSQTAFAQNAVPASPTPASPIAATAGDAQLQEIVVTAQKRSENLQDVPIAITAVSGEQVRSLHIDSARELPNLVPGLLYSQAGGTTQTYLRGIGTSVTQVNADPSVATYIDGVYISLSTVTSVKLSDIHSVEVLKGPQGTLYGRNATGGAVSITTKNPTKDFGAELSAGVGSFNRREAGLSVSGGLTNTLFAGVYANYQSEDPYSKLENPPGLARPAVRGRDFQWTTRAKLIFDPGSFFRITASADETHYGSFQDLAYRQLQADAEGYGNATIGAPATRNPGRYSVSLNGLVDNNWQAKGASLRTEFEVGSLKLVELSAYRDSRSFTNADGDATAAVVAATVVSLKQISKQTTHELQLQSSHGGRLQWIVGAFYYRDNGRLDPFNIQAPPFDQKISAGVITTSYSGFGQLTWSLTDALGITLGGRYTSEKKRYTGGTFVQTPAPPAPAVFDPRQKTFNEFNPKVGINYHLGNTLLYASFSNGFKSGVYNLNGTTALAIGPVNPERLTAYEFGTKSEFFDRTVRLNTAFFHYDYRDLQVQTITPFGAVLQNAARAHSNGFDVDGAWALSHSFELRFNGEYLNSTYDSFPAFQGKVPRGTARGGNMDQPGGVDVSGFTAARSPKLSGSVGFSWANELSNGSTLKLSSNLFHTAHYAFNPDHTANQKAYSTLSMSADFSPASQVWGLSVWAKNITDTYYYAYKQINTNGIYGIPAVPRTIGATVSLRFGKR